MNWLYFPNITNGINCKHLFQLILTIHMKIKYSPYEILEGIRLKINQEYTSKRYNQKICSGTLFRNLKFWNYRIGSVIQICNLKIANYLCRCKDENNSKEWMNHLGKWFKLQLGVLVDDRRRFHASATSIKKQKQKTKKPPSFDPLLID